MGAVLPAVKLGNVTAPALAYGTGTAWMSRNGQEGASEALSSSVAAALKLGFRHIDCAEVIRLTPYRLSAIIWHALWQMYKTEEDVSLGIRQSGVRREDLFITSKLYPSLDNPEAGIRSSLARLGSSYLDLYLVHSPFKFSTKEQIQEAWAKLEDCVRLGLTRNLGVSNFRVQDLEALLETAKIPPLVNQIEFHPYLQSPELCAFCSSHGIKIESYGSLAPILGASGGPLDPVLDRLSTRHGVSKAQVLLRWVIEKGYMAVTTTSKEERMTEYLAISKFELSAEDMQEIDTVGLTHDYRRFWVKDFAGATADARI